MRAMKEVTIITLKTGESIEITLQEGNGARKAKAQGKGSIVIRSMKNRMIDVTMIGDIQDKWVEDHQQHLVVDHSIKLLDTKLVPQPATDESPGYIKFKQAQDLLRQKLGKRTRPY